MRKRCIDMHGFKRNGTLPALAFRIKSSHVVQTVGKLYKDNTDILGHSKKHLSEVFYALVFFVFKMYIRKLSQSVNKFGNLSAKLLFEYVKVRFILTILNSIVQKSSADGISVKLELSDNNSNRNGMSYIWLTGLSELSFVHGSGILVR